MTKPITKAITRAMPRPSGASSISAPAFARNRPQNRPHNRWISPRQAEMLESLWNARLRRAGRRPRPDRTEEERLRHIAETVGRSVASPRELSWREANRVLRRLLDEVRSNPAAPVAAPASGPKRSSKRSLAKQSPASEETVARLRKNSTQRRKPRHA